jgi:hypothetical protein
LINLYADLEQSPKDDSDYSHWITDLEHDLASVNTTLRILQAAATHTILPMVKPVKLPHLPEVSRDCKELLNFISKVHSKVAGESSCYTDN